MHGEFQTTSYVHTRPGSGLGCKACSHDRHMNQRIQRTRRRFNDYCLRNAYRFDLSQAQFELITDKITVICNKHGPFITQVDGLLNENIDCTKCNNERKTGGYSTKFFKSHPEVANLPGILYLLEMTHEKRTLPQDRNHTTNR